jgi:hypothetical protein
MVSDRFPLLAAVVYEDCSLALHSLSTPKRDHVVQGAVVGSAKACSKGGPGDVAACPDKGPPHIGFAKAAPYPRARLEGHRSLPVASSNNVQPKLVVSRVSAGFALPP